MTFDFNEKEIEFINKEFSYSREWLNDMSKSRIDELYDKLADIEVEETMNAGDNDLNERGIMAETLVTFMSMGTR